MGSFPLFWVVASGLPPLGGTGDMGTCLEDMGTRLGDTTHGQHWDILDGSPLGHHPTSLVPSGMASMVTAGWDWDVGDKDVLFHTLTAMPSQPRPQSHSPGSPSQHPKG